MRALAARLVAALAQRLMNPLLLSESSLRMPDKCGGELVQGTIGFFLNDAVVQGDLHAQFGISPHNEI